MQRRIKLGQIMLKRGARQYEEIYTRRRSCAAEEEKEG